MTLRLLAAAESRALEGNARGWRLRVHDPADECTLTRANACAGGALVLAVPMGEGPRYYLYASPEALWERAAGGAASGTASPSRG